MPKGIHLILTATKTLKSRICARTYNLPFTRNPMQSAHRNGIKGLVHTSPGKKICGLKNQSGFVWRGLTSVSEKRVLSVGIKEKYKDVRCLNLIWVKKVKRKTQLSDWHVLLIIMLEILPAEHMYMYPHEPVSKVLNYKYCFILKKIVVGQVRS